MVLLVTCGHLWSAVVTGLPRNAFQFDWFPQEEVAPAYKYLQVHMSDVKGNNESDESELKRKRSWIQARVIAMHRAMRSHC